MIRDFASSNILPASNDKSVCDDLLRNLTHAAGKAIECLTSHVAPSAYCGWCAIHLAGLKNLLENRTVINEFGVPCVDLIVESSKVI